MKLIELPKFSLYPVKLHPTPNLATGQDIYVIGYPLFYPNASTMSGSISSGILSKVVRHKGSPTLLQTNAIVQRGNSGGLIINTKGNFLGIITSNSQHNIDNKVQYIPKLNYAIPVNKLKPIHQFLKSKDVSYLNGYNKKNKQISKIWNFENSDNDIKLNKFMEFFNDKKFSKL